MRTARRALVGALLLVGLAAGVGYAAPGAARSPARLQVTADEFTLTLSRPSIPSGAAIVELVNVGEDEHDLALRRVGNGAVTRRIRAVEPGGVDDLFARLRGGRFRLWCTLADHRARGMSATLVVRGRASA